MKSLCVWIDYQPGLYQDLLLKYFQYLNQDLMGIKLVLNAGSVEKSAPIKQPIDIFILSIDKFDPEKTLAFHSRSPLTKLVVFSPKGNQGWRCITQQADWELIQPFGLMRLSYEVLSCKGAHQPGSPPDWSVSAA
jgi:hypothetical protein